MAGSDFLAKIKLSLEGKEQVVSGLQQTQQAAQQLSKTKVTTIFDKEGVATGKQIEETFTKIKPATDKANVGMKDFISAMKRALIVAPVWMIMRGAMMSVFSALQALPTAAIAWEKEMANIKRVGKGTAGEYEILSVRLLDLSKKYGIASETMGKGAALWAQQGKSLTEIVPLMETTIKLSLITGKSVSESVEDITAIMKSYKIEAADTSNILDKLIKVEQEHAITTNVLTDAMKKGGPVAAQFGVSFEKFLGIITATHVATRASGGEIGNAWKTIFARMATSAIPAIQNIAKVPVYMDAAGKSTYQNTGTFRNWGDVLDEVMVTMGSLNETQQIALTSALAMKRTLNYLLSAYQNWDEGIKATVESLDSVGVSDKAVNTILGTTAQKTEQLKSAWSELGVTIINNGQIIKDTVDLLKFLVSEINDVTLAFHGMPGLEIKIAGMGKKELDAQVKQADTLLNQIKSINELKKLAGQAKEFELRITADTRLKEDEKKKILSTIQERQKYIQETIDKQPQVQQSEIFLQSYKQVAADLQKVRDKITALATQAPETARVEVGLLTIAPVKDIEARIEKLKKISPELTLFKKEGIKESINFLEKVLNLRKEELGITSPEYLKATEEKLKNSEKFSELTKEFKDDNKEITHEQEEQLKLDREIAVFSLQRGITEEQILQKRIELVKVSEKYTNEQSRSLDLAKLENQLIDAKLKKRDDELSKLASMSMQYEKADMFEKSRIRRAAELSLMKPEEIAQAYQGGGLDKQTIEDYWQYFSKEAQQAVEATTTLFRDLSYKIPEVKIPKLEDVINQQPKLIAQLTQQVTGAEKIDIIINGAKMTPEELSQIMAGQINNNPEFRKAIVDAALNTNTR